MKLFEIKEVETDDGDDYTPPSVTATLTTSRGSVEVFEWIGVVNGDESPETDGNMHMNQREEISELFEDSIPWYEIHEALRAVITK